MLPYKCLFSTEFELLSVNLAVLTYFDVCNALKNKKKRQKLIKTVNSLPTMSTNMHSYNSKERFVFQNY